MISKENTMSERVAILGASNKEERYSYKAKKMLEEYGHETFLVHPRLKEIEGQKVYSALSALKADTAVMDTLTVYIGPALSSNMIEDIVDFRPGRIIFNPGTENPELEERLEEAGVPFERACTLILLKTDQF
jgi:uncharacterized protein